MNILFLTRKASTDVGGLSRFCRELPALFPKSQIVRVGSLSSWHHIQFSRVDIIHTTDATLLPVGVLLKWLLGKPLTLTAHGLDLTWRNSLYQYMLRTLLPSVAAIAVDSNATFRLLRPFSIAKIPVRTIHPGISIDRFVSKTPFPLTDSRRKMMLLTVGNLVRRKGYQWFIEQVFPSLPEHFLYVIVGDGPERAAIERAILRQKLSRRVLLLGRMSDEKLSFLLRNADMYVAPNQHIPGDFEGFGIALGEATAMGLPVVANNVDGIPDIIHDQKNGWLIPPTAHAFRAALLRLKDTKARRRLGQRARAYTRTQFTWQKTGIQYGRFFLKALER